MKYLKDTIRDFISDDCTTMAAALAYYTLFALPSLLLVIIGIVGAVLGREAAQGKIQAQIEGLIGSGAAGQVGTIVQKAGQHHSTGILSAIVGLATLILGASAAFAQLQTSLNTVWRVKPDPDQGGVKNFIMHRLLSFGTVVAVGFLLLVSLAVSAALAGLQSAMAGWLSEGFSKTLVQGIDILVSFVVISALFAAILKVLPDVEIAWKQVWVGAVVTGALFIVGKSLIGLYLGKSGAATVYGPAGSLVLIVLWIYYSSMIVLLGAEFTRTWLEAHGGLPEPKQGAVREVVREERVPAKTR